MACEPAISIGRSHKRTARHSLDEGLSSPRGKKKAMAMNMNVKKKKKIMMMARMVMGADAADKRPYITGKSYVPGGQWKPTGPKPPMSRKLWHDKAKTQRHLKMISISMHHEPRSSRLTSGGHSWREDPLQRNRVFPT